MNIVPQDKGGETMRKITKIEAKKEPETRLRVAAYARVSTKHEDQLLSLECQKVHYEQVIKSHADWEYVGLFYDEGISGTKMETRGGLIKMLDACDRGEIDYILVKSISRFSRNTVESIEVVRHLCSLGVHMYFEKENINTKDMESELLLSILSSLAESESRSISENNKWGIRQRFRSGTFKQSCMPYGYDSKDGDFVINKEQAAIVRRIFNEILSGKSMSDIANALNDDGVAAPRNVEWGASSIKSIVSNEKYIGDALYQKTFTDEHFTKHTNYGELDQFYVKNHHEPIIDVPTFNAANEAILRNAKEKGVENGTAKYLARYALSGKVICGCCGGKLKRVKVGNYFSMGCVTHIKNKDECSMKSIKEDAIKTAFVTMMNKLIFARKEVLVPLEEELRTYGKEAFFKRTGEIDSRIEELSKRKTKIIAFYSSGLISPAAYASEISSIEQEEEALTKEQRKLIQRINGSSDRYENLVELLKYTRGKGTLKEFDDDLFSRFVSQVIVYKRSEIGFELKCGPVFRERIKP